MRNPYRGRGIDEVGAQGIQPDGGVVQKERASGVSLPLLLVVIAAGLAGGCASAGGGQIGRGPAEANAVYTDTPPVMDGRLDDAAWRQAPVYHLAIPMNRTSGGKAIAEQGEVRFLWDERDLYVCVAFTDADIVSFSDKDQLLHLLKGDLFELFLKPENAPDETWFWELYATPNGRKTAYFYPGKGWAGVDECYTYDCGVIQVAADVKGTLNEWRDRDQRWTAVIKVPVAELRKRGERFGPGSKWRFLVARYNYGRYLPELELSSFPPLSRADWQLVNEYGILNFSK